MTDPYDCCAHFIPKNTAIENVSEVKTVQFTCDTTNKNDVDKIVQKEAQNKFDSYGLRNHWDLYDVEIQYNNKPWDSKRELMAKIQEISDLKIIDMPHPNQIYVKITNNQQTNVSVTRSNFKSNARKFYEPIIIEDRGLGCAIFTEAMFL